MRETQLRISRTPRRRWIAAALVTLTAGVAATPAPAAKSTSQRLKALEQKARTLENATKSLTAQHKALASAQTSLVASYNSLNARYTGFVGCLRRTPVFSWPGYSFGNPVTTTTTALDWYNPAGVFTTGVLPNFTNKIHALSLANTQGCLDFAAFRDPTIPGAALNAAPSPAEAKP
jgi:type II secretory pathway pseudopilin PulG